jgi:uncharacterized protein YjdB
MVRSFGVLVVVASLFVASAAVAADSVTVGSVTADGPSVDVPVYIRDASGSPLGMDQPPASRIQAFSIRVNYSPAAAVSSVTFTRAGITASKQPIFETSPSSSGSISLLASFQQSSNPLPFTLDAAAPGNQVAHLVFNLSPSATPGTNITLTLDSGTTQLTDEGGSAATKESSASGLVLVNGSITIPVPTITLTPPSQSLQAGISGSLSATTSVRVVSDTFVSLTSSNPAAAMVPAGVTIQAGNRVAGINVTAVAAGTATITATLPLSSGGGIATAIVTVTAAPQCATPAAPQLNGPASALAGSTYAITWTPIGSATDYVIEESVDAAFADVSAQTVTATTSSYSHPSAGIRYYYRVRARNRSGSCNITSAASSAVSVLITSVPLPPAVRILPAVASGPGAAGSFFKTSLQLYNPKVATISGRIVYHPQGVEGSESDPSLAYSIPAGKTLTFADLLPAMGVAGLGSADVIADTTSPLPVTLARIFNDAGTAGTTGLALEAMDPQEALRAGGVGAILAPTDLQKFRLNIGVRTLENGVSMNVTVRDRDGAVLNTVAQSFPPTYFKQNGSADFLDGFVLTGGETISIEITAGAAFIYGSTTDNVTNDPSVQFARRVE